MPEWQTSLAQRFTWAHNNSTGLPSTGPSFKLCCLENSFIRSIELAEQLLKTNSVEAVLVGAVDNDPILENVIWLEW